MFDSDGNLKSNNGFKLEGNLYSRSDKSEDKNFSEDNVMRMLNYFQRNAQRTGPYCYGPGDKHDWVTCFNRGMRNLLEKLKLRAKPNMGQQMNVIQEKGYDSQE